MNSVRSNNQSMKYQVFTPSGLQDIGIIKFEFVAKTQFLCMDFTQYKIFTQPITPITKHPSMFLGCFVLLRPW